ncbi:MAG TPA: FAD-binding protein [Candidatus Acidoferrales bacterium]|nr:FAD-binding protein [Candidatus Acidoferrales bacterium]
MLLDYVVVGAGVAGLRAAIELGGGGRVLVLAKGACSAAGARPGEDDEIGLHEPDTLRAGEGLCNPDAVKALVEDGPDRLRELIAWGAKLDHAGAKPGHNHEGARDRRNRGIPAQGDTASAEIRRVLLARAGSLKSISLRRQAFATELTFTTAAGGRVTGIRYLDESCGRMAELECRAVVLATGGLGQAFRETTSPAAATGDGMAIGYRAGAALADMEFVQFHPTALAVKGAPPLPLPEALRAEGAVLRNAMLERFMPHYHETAELAPAGVLCRAIVSEMRRTRAGYVYLDATGLGEAFVAKRFPRLHAACMKHGLDLTADLAPVGPAAHYAIGGLKTDLFGRTTLTGLYAAGETASTGVHGANRAAGNSLLEGLVFGARAGKAALEDAPAKAAPAKRAVAARQPKRPAKEARESDAAPEAEVRDPLRERIRAVLWQRAGVLREGRELARAIEQLASMEVSRPAAPSRRAWELYNLWTVAQVISRSALAREESRGSHYRADFPYPDEERFARHSVASCEGGVRFE